MDMHCRKELYGTHPILGLICNRGAIGGGGAEVEMKLSSWAGDLSSHTAPGDR